MAPQVSRARELAILAMSRRSVSPTAMGRIPPSFLVNGNKDAPKKRGRTASGMLPARIKLQKSAMDSHTLPPTLSSLKSFRCCGLSPSLPPADPGANERMVDFTSAADTVIHADKIVGFVLRSGG